MGRIGSSFKRKSSRRKISKSSSEAQQKKRSKRNKSKKLRRHDDSVSSYSDDESTSSVSALSSSSEDGYKSRRARSRLRDDSKGSRKRARRSSSVRKSGKDSPHVRKRKRLKRNGDPEARRKKLKKKKKKPRREASISSASSDQSCSTCRGGSSSSEEREFERLRGRSREKKDKSESGKVRSGTRKNEIRSLSCSLCSKSGDSDGDNSIEKLAVENSSRRLRSVITIARQPEEEEGNEVNKDELKEEIVYDQDDYPSCRSNDSNDGGSKRELDHHSSVVSQKRRMVENVRGEETSVSNLITAEPTLSCKNDNDEYDGLNRGSNGARNDIPNQKESDVSVTVGSDVNNLESILRQKALENLTRFRGGCQTNAKVPTDEKNKSDTDVKQLSTAKVELVQSKPPKQDGSSGLGASESLIQRSRFTWRRDSSLPTGTVEKITHEKFGGTESGAPKQNVVCLPDGAGISGKFEEKDHIIAHAIKDRSESSRSQALISQGSIVHKSTVATSQTMDESSSNNHSVGIIEACGSTAPETPSCISAEENSTREPQNEAKDSSQFQQKTMSVMRGGEMVQVSYKVYIPKKAPALARRKLIR